MSDAASTYVEEAVDKASWMVNREARGPGDTDNAMRRLEMRLGIPYSAFYALRYRRPKSIGTELFVRICEAHETERARHKRLFENEDAKAAPRTKFGEAIVRMARAAVRPEDGALE